MKLKNEPTLSTLRTKFAIVFVTAAMGCALAQLALPILSIMAWCTAFALSIHVFYQLNTAQKLISHALGESKSIVSYCERTEAKNREEENFIEALTSGAPPTPFKILSTEKGIGSKLISLHEKLAHYKKEEQKLSWSQGGLAKFSELLKTEGTLNSFADLIISNLVKYLAANQGALFVQEKDHKDTRWLQLYGCYAYDKKKHIDKKIMPGEGMLGQCMYDQSLAYITEVPKNYISITSGLGGATPRCIAIVPLLFNETFYGAIELASFTVLQKHELEFLQKVTEGIAAEIASRQSAQVTEGLLKDSQELAGRLQAQEEEIHQSMEELTATQEEMGRKKAELESVFNAINNTVASLEFDMNGNITYANTIFQSLSEYSLPALKKLSYTDLLPEGEAWKPQHNMMWDNLRQAKFFAGEYKFVSKENEEMWLSGTFNPILNANGEAKKVIMIAQVTTQEKAKQLDLTNAVQALKNTVPYVELDMTFKCKAANDRFLKLNDIKRIELAKLDFCNFLQDASCAKFKSSLLRVTKQTYHEEILCFKSEPDVAFRTTFNTIKDLNDNVVRILVILADKVSIAERSTSEVA
jgi:PAS domain S-box-containing protein